MAGTSSAEAGAAAESPPTVSNYHPRGRGFSADEDTAVTRFSEAFEFARQESVAVDSGGGAADSSIDRAEAAAESQEKHARLVEKAQAVYAAHHPKHSAFTSLACWEVLRRSLSWDKYVSGSAFGKRPSVLALTVVLKSGDDAMAKGGGSKPSSSRAKRRASTGGAELTGELRPPLLARASRKKRRVSDFGPESTRRQANDDIADDDAGDKRSSKRTRHTADARTEMSAAPVATSELVAPPSADALSAKVSALSTPQLGLEPASTRARGHGGFLSVFSPPQPHTEEGDEVVQWTVRENRLTSEVAAAVSASQGARSVADAAAVAASFAVFDDNRRIEVLVGGVYQLHLYLEPQGTDDSRYFLEVNGSACSAFERVGGSPSSDAAVPLKTPNVAQVRLSMWDMITLRRRRCQDGEVSSSASDSRTPFARFIIEFVRE
ncbi:hypothetical protein PybrP1_002281 [[Pythium] brassicae (nom. inval.)]|nr:hypothetical protein PybrP1_002281 [[Pythium] brassicae (nom. inval.)]